MKMEIFSRLFDNKSFILQESPILADFKIIIFLILKHNIF